MKILNRVFLLSSGFVSHEVLHVLRFAFLLFTEQGVNFHASVMENF